jgi:hypothetical protein
MMTVAIAADLVRWFQLPAWTAPGSTPDRRPCPGGIFHTPGRLVRRARQRKYASSTVGPAPTHCLMPTDASTYSPDRSQRPASRHPAGDTRPDKSAR